MAGNKQPEYKRRWTQRDWGTELVSEGKRLVAEASEKPVAAARNALSARAIATSVMEDPRARAIADAVFTAWDDVSSGTTELVLADAVPFLSALRYTDTGLAKRAKWEHVWSLQRREDAGGKPDIQVPPRYDNKDYRDPIFWRLRGKLDVPKERFISYPGAEKDDDKSPLFGWAGWDHLQQGTALSALYHERKTEDGWPRDRLVPLLAGLLELVPWLKQWHNAPNDDFGGEGPGDWYERYVEAEARSIGKSVDDLRAWRPTARGGRKQKGA